MSFGGSRSRPVSGSGERPRFAARLAGPVRRRAVLLTGSLALLVGTAVLLPLGRGGAAEPAKYVGSDVCQGCHADWAKGTLHMKALSTSPKPGAESGCEACHGPGGDHPVDPGRGNIFSPKKASPEKVAAMCMKCHKQFNTAEWKSSEHARNKMSCLQCHTIHQPGGDGLLQAKQEEMCLKCHPKVRGELNLTSHHPVREGRLHCTDCHNPHSGRNAGMLTKPDVGALCVSCHADKRGPFRFEHDPIVSGMADGCLSCHRPHGSPNFRLQKIAGRGVCLQCHATVIAPGGSHAGFFPPGVGGSQCIDCHEKIHGSNRSELFFR